MRINHKTWNTGLVLLLSLTAYSLAAACSQPIAPATQPPSSLPAVSTVPATQPTTPAGNSTSPTNISTPQSQDTPRPNAVFTLTSTAFEEGANIPARYTCAGDDFSPPLAWQNAPAGTRSFAIIVDDPEGANWVHWIIFNLPPDLTSLAENVRKAGKLDNGAVQGYNSFGKTGYNGPCPPSRHHYYFTIYALNTMLNAQEGTGKDALTSSMSGKVLGKAALMGLYP